MEPPDAADDSPAPPDLPADSSGPDGSADLPRDTAADARDGAGPDLPPGIDLTMGLVGHWKFDEGMTTMTADSSGRANTGTLSGGGLPDWTPGGAPIPANPFSLTFDGVDDYVALKDNLAPVLGGTASLSCWIKTTQTGANNSFDAPGVTGVEQGGGSDDIFWGFIDAGGNIGLRPGSGRTVKSAAPINDNQWHHIVMTRDETSGHIQIFVDGKLAKADDGMQTGKKSTAFAALGRITNSSKPYFKGQLDDVRIWDRVLSPAEVTALFMGN
jgi:MSHA biogenesis protein MshQ